VSTGKYGNVVDLSHTRDVATTMAAMESGAGVIFQAPLSLDFVSDVDGSSQGSLKGFRGVADFLVKVPLGQAQASSHTSPHNGFGLSYTYQVWDAKLTKRPAPSHVLQLWCYTDMVSQLAASSAAALSSSMNQLNMKKTVESLDVATAATKGPPRAVLVLNAASTPTPIDLAPYGAYYRAAVRCLPFYFIIRRSLTPAKRFAAVLNHVYMYFNNRAVSFFASIVFSEVCVLGDLSYHVIPDVQPGEEVPCVPCELQSRHGSARASAFTG